MSDLSNSDCDGLLADLTSNNLTKAQRRWRIAYAAIYSFRVMLSLANDIVSRKSTPGSHILTPLPYVSLDVAPLSSQDFDGANSAPLSFPPNVNQKTLTDLVKEKDHSALTRLGGTTQLAAALKANPEHGIDGDQTGLNLRRELFGPNTYKITPPKGLLFFVIEASKDTTLLILMAAAALSLVFGIKEHGWEEGWYEGGSIFLAVFLVVVVSALSNFRQERQFDKLSKISSNIKVESLRDGRRVNISIFDIVVGDIVFLKIGDQIPADGLFLDGHSLHVDESSMTGESDHLEVSADQNPFLFSGTKVADGYARMLVVSVGMNTEWGQMMSSISRDSNERTPLQDRLDNLTTSIGKAGLTVAALVLVVLLVRYFTGHTEDKDGNVEFRGHNTSLDAVFNSVVRIVAVAVTIVVVAIPEGLPLAVTLTLAYSMKRMMNDQAMVRKLAACETMGSATMICTDKTGTLTLNEMKVTKFWIGQDSIFDDSCGIISPDVLALFYQGVGLNTTGSVCTVGSDIEYEFSGSPTEKSILSWAVLKLRMNMENVKRNHTVLHVETFNSAKKRSGVAVQRISDATFHVHWKGAAEMIVAMCTHFYESNGEVKAIDVEARSQFERIIKGMAASSLRCIAFAHKQLAQNPAIESGSKSLPEDGLTLLGMVGLKDPCRPGVKKAVDACKRAGVSIKMITGDNVFTAKAIAAECGILEMGDEVEADAVVEGVVFRNYTDEERLRKVNKIRVMARSSPFDKLLMVKCLKQNGHVVAVTGDGTNDAPALQEADIGLSMGIQGTEVAKESSDIVILDDNFTSVAIVLKWGRCVYNNIQKFIQFQLTVNVAALVINFIAAVSAGEVPLTTVQLLWVNLIMDTLGALALATERPSNELLKRKPVGRTEPLITNVMWRNLLAQSIYQISILLTMQFRGRDIFSVNTEVKNTMIFNTFVLCQVFNEFNSREMEKHNVFKGIHRNKQFIGIVAVTLALQFVMVEFLKKFADTVSLNLWQWGVCAGIASLSWPIAWCVKLIPVGKRPFMGCIKNPSFTYLRLKKAMRKR